MSASRCQYCCGRTKPVGQKCQSCRSRTFCGVQISARFMGADVAVVDEPEAQQQAAKS